MCVCICCPPPCKPRRDPTQFKITLQNQPFGRQREEGNGDPVGPSSLPVSSRTPVPFLLSPFARSWILGWGRGSLSGEGKGCGWQGPCYACTLLKVTPASCWQSCPFLRYKDRMWSSRNFPSKGSLCDWSRKSGFLLFPCCLVPPWGMGHYARLQQQGLGWPMLIYFDSENYFKVGGYQGTFLINQFSASPPLVQLICVSRVGWREGGNSAG